MISYKPFLKWMIDNDIESNYLNEVLGISWTTISKIKKGSPLRMDIVEKLCLHFDLRIEEFMEIKKSPKDKT